MTKPRVWLITFALAVSCSREMSPSEAFQVAFPAKHSPQRSTLLASIADDDGIGVGIDLGTTNSAIAILKEGTPDIVEIPNNGRTMPSIVAILSGDNDDDDHVVVGKEAMDSEGQCYWHVKRVIGAGSTYISPETAKVVPHLILPSPAKEDAKSKKNNKKKKKTKVTLQKTLDDAQINPAQLRLGKEGDTISPIELSSMILKKLLDTASQATGSRITRAVVGVPAYFNDAQREATIEAANLAGIDKVRLLPEPEAAALAYGTNLEPGVEELVLVFDLGGGTYDVSMLLIQDGLTEILCTSGDAQLGGSNFDFRIAQHLSKLVSGNRFSKGAFDNIVRVAEQVRICLSNNRRVKLALPLTEEGWMNHVLDSEFILPSDFDISGSGNTTHMFTEMTRKQMESLCHKEFVALLKPIREVAIMAGALLPGDARPSLVATALELEELYSGAVDEEYEDFYQEDVVDATPSSEDLLKNAKKTQQRGRKKSRETSKKERQYREESRKASETSMTESKVISGDGISGRPIARVALVGGATRMPGVGRIISALTGVVPQKTVDPDEAVALGCAKHAGILDGENTDDEMGTVLTPMQAAILRAVARQQRKEEDGLGDDDDDDFEIDDYGMDFSSVQQSQ